MEKENIFPFKYTESLFIGDMLQNVLSVYMFEGGGTLRLPTADEILLCTPHTRLEEVRSSLSYGSILKLHKKS